MFPTDMVAVKVQPMYIARNIDHYNRSLPMMAEKIAKRDCHFHEFWSSIEAIRSQFCGSDMQGLDIQMDGRTTSDLKHFCYIHQTHVDERH